MVLSRFEEIWVWDVVEGDEDGNARTFGHERTGGVRRQRRKDPSGTFASQIRPDVSHVR